MIGLDAQVGSNADGVARVLIEDGVEERIARGGFRLEIFRECFEIGGRVIEHVPPQVGVRRHPGE